MISPDLVKQRRPRVAKIWMEAAISKNCQVLQRNGSSDSEDESSLQVSIKPVPDVLQRGTVLLRKINLTLGDLWSIKDLTEHFTRGKTLTSVSWPDYTVLVKTSLEHFGSSFAFLTLSWVPGSLLVPSEFKWVLPTKAALDLALESVPFYICCQLCIGKFTRSRWAFVLVWFWCCQVSGSYLNSKTEVEIKKQPKSQVILSTSRCF